MESDAKMTAGPAADHVNAIEGPAKHLKNIVKIHFSQVFQK